MRKLLLMFALMSTAVCAAVYQDLPWERYISEVELSALSEAEKKGLAIAIQEDLADQGWIDFSADMVLTIRSASGAESVREISLITLEGEAGDKSLSIVRTPRDLSGTAFLTYTKVNEPDDQWIYLASISRVRRINASNQSSSYMGSEFSYEDLASFEVNNYRYEFLRQEEIDGKSYYVVQRYPNDRNSGYSKIISWIDVDHYKRERVEFYDRKGDLLKTLTRSDYQLFNDKHWRARRVNMHNHQSGRSSEMYFETINFNVGLTERDFDRQSLSRAR